MYTKKEVLTLSETIKKVVEAATDTEKLGPETLAVARLVDAAIKRGSSFPEELVLVKSVDINGLNSDGPMIDTRWYVRGRRTDKETV